MSESRERPRGLPSEVAWIGEHLLGRVDRLGQPAARGRIARGARAVTLVAVTLVAIFVGLGASVAAVAGIADGVRVASGQLASSRTPASPFVGTPVTESMTILTGKEDGRPGWPRFTHATWSVHAGQVVTVRITSHDDGTAPLMGSQTMYDTVEGTVGGTETVDGRAVRTVATENIAHTFTVVALGLNLPVPAAPTGGTVTVVARFVPKLTGSFVWQCYAPCGSGMNSMGGAMSTMSWMEGKVRVIA